MLRELDFDDAPQLLELLRSEAELGRLWGDPVGLDLAQAESFILAALITGDDAYRAVCGEDDEFLGLIGLKNLDQGKAEFCIALTPAARRRGLGRAAACQLLDWAFSTLSLDKVYMYTRDDNLATRAFNLACGFSPQEAEPGVELPENATAQTLSRLRWFGVKRTDFYRQESGCR